jgi:hypothetical protein
MLRITFLILLFTYNFAFASEPVKIEFIGPKNDVLYFSLGKDEPLTGNLEQLKYFFEQLDRLKNKDGKLILRIAHFGDSLIQGDVISEYLREYFQTRFGGQGVGMMQIIANDIRMRTTTRHSYSDDWDYVSVITRNPDNLPIGISGSLAIPNKNSWVKYETGRELKSASSFKYARLFYSNAASNSVIEYTIDNGSPVRISLKEGNNVQELIIDAKGDANSIRIKFVDGKRPYFYGVSLESGSGIYLDNFPMPGNSGVSLIDIPEKILQDYAKLTNYGLIILTYGANVNSPNKAIYKLYKNKMLKVIEHFRKAFPNVGFILVGVGDKTMKRGGRFITNPDVPLLLNAQKQIVSDGKIAFWNLWEAMGGENSMEDWVNANPPMALKDYSHFTKIGGKRVAELLFNAIMKAYSSR